MNKPRHSVKVSAQGKSASVGEQASVSIDVTEPVEGLRARKKRQQAQAIVDCARRLFSEHGFQQTTVEMICQQLAISHVTFFNYFASKDKLLEVLAGESTEAFLALVSWLMAEPDWLTRMPEQDQAMISQVLPASAGNADESQLAVNRRLQAELVRVMSSSALGQSFVQRLQETLSDHLQRTVDSHELAMTGQDIALYARLMSDLLVGTFNNWLNDQQVSLAQRLADCLIFLRQALAVNQPLASNAKD